MKSNSPGYLSYFIAVFLFFSYILLSLSLIEFHPFSRFPMYDSFPNYSYSFYVADAKGSLIPYTKNFRTHADEISHMYVEICDEHHFAHGLGIETDGQLAVVGKELLDYIIRAKRSSFRGDTLAIHRVHYEFKDGKIVKHDKRLYQSKVE